MIRLKKLLYQWQYKLDDMTLRERVLIFITAVIVIFFVWSQVLMRYVQYRSDLIASRISSVKQEVTLFEGQTKQILIDAKTQNTQQLLSQHSHLQKMIDKLDKKVANYQLTVVNSTQVSKMLHAILKDIKGVKLLRFDTINDVEEPSRTASSWAKKTSPTYYQLILRGNFFAIQAYLTRLEMLSWKIFWDKFDYKVSSYPYAEVDILFHTLRIKNGKSL